MPEPKILFYDIETSHNLVAVFKLFGEDYISPDNIVQERYIICASWKWLGGKKVTASALPDNARLFAKNPNNDYHVCKALHDILSQADVIVAHNGDKYDIKFTEGRMIAHGLPPLPPIVKIDTLKVAKSRFLFNSNRLDYIGKYLRVGQKKHTSNGLWLRVLQHDKAAIAEMVKYNKQDVLLLERVFLKLRPYMANHINRQLFGNRVGCPRCGSAKVQARGFARTTTGVYQRWQCECGGWFRSKKATKVPVTVRAI